MTMRVAAGALPLAAFALLWRHAFRRSGDAGTSLLAAATGWGVAVTVITEGLGLAAALTPAGVAACWGLVAAALLARGTRPRSGGAYVPSGVAPSVATGGVLVIAAVTLAIAIAAPPNTWDSMTYHLPRITQWIQQQSVAHFPAASDRQLHLAPWAEFAVLQFHLLAGGDRWDNLIQWFGMAGSLVAITLLARRLGGGRAAAELAAVFAATLPMGLLQSTSTQTDYVEAFWLLTTLWFALEASAARGEGAPEPWLLAGCAWGLAILTKATALVFGPPFLLLGWWVARGRGARPMRGALLAALAAGALYAGHGARNVALFGTPLSPRAGESGHSRTMNEAMGPARLASTMLRDLAVHATTPFPRINLRLEAGVRRILAALGQDADDPRTTLDGVAFAVNGPPLDEDYAGNPLHLLLVAAMFAFLASDGRLFRARPLGWYAWALAASACGFCAVLKWQPWNSRLELPLFLLAAPLVGAVCARRLRPRAVRRLVLLLLLAALPWLLHNRTRPVFPRASVFTTPREVQLFRKQPELLGPYRAAAAYLAAAGYSQVGLFARVAGSDDWEYPLWSLLREPAAGRIRFEHLHVENRSAALLLRPPWRDFSPEAIVTFTPAAPRAVAWGGAIFRPIRAFGPLRILARAAAR